jgi:uncharacterized protein (DUF1697 family)
VPRDRWVVLWRGLNVGRANRLTMAELRGALAEAGFPGARTYLQSGNAVLRAPHDEPADALAARLAAAVSERTGGEVRAHVLTVDQLRRAVQGNPFPAATSTPRSVHLFFLAGAPDAAADERLQEVVASSERFVLRDDVLYLHAPDGIGRSKLAASAERRLGVPATARNWRTVTAVLDLAERED